MGFRLFKSVFKFPKDTVFDCLIPFMYLTKPLEYFNFTIEGPLTNAVIKIKAFNIITFIGYRIFYITIMVFSLMKGPETYDSFLMDTGNYIFLITCYIVTALSAIILFVSNYSYYDILKNCYEVDKILEQFGIFINNNKNFISFVKFVIIDSIFFTIINIISIHVYKSSALQNFIPFGHLYVIYCIYIILLSVVIERFKSINLCLR